MMQCGRVRSPLTCQAAICPPTGTSIMATHHPSRMLPRAAPTRMAIFSPSPVLVGTDAARTSGPRMNARTSSGSHSNPPVAMITPRAAPTSTEPSAVPQQLHRAHAGARLDAAVQAALEQRPDQALPGPALVPDLPPLQLRGVDALRGAAAQAGLAHHDVARQLRSHRDPVLPRAQRDEREQRALH